jgi:3-hydroxymyristoyl/3-hydroxydecanoyl-(acyl carrier protein) dehydratase
MAELRQPQTLAVRRQSASADIELHVPPDLYWFRGHFPGAPILPGVVQIDWALAMAREHLGLGFDAGRTLRVKFRSVIQPGDRLTLAIRYLVDRDAIAFEYRRGDEVCSNGQIGAAP